MAWPEGTGRIEGRILMPDGKTPAAGAVLTAIHLVSGRTFPAGPTSESGSYRIDNLPYGYFEFAVESGGTLFAVTRPLDLPPGLAKTMEVRLSDGGPPPAGTENLENGLVLTGFDRRATAVAVPLGSDKDSSRWTKKKTAFIGGAALLALLLLQ